VVESTMDVSEWLRKQLEQASPDLLRGMVQDFAEALMGAEADALCGAGYGERSPQRVTKRNGYRERDWDTRVGTIELAIPKLRAGSYFPDWLLQPRRRAEQAFVSVIADAYLAGVSTRRVEKLVQQLGVERMSKSQVSRLAQSLDQIVADFRTRPLEAAPYPYLVLDALEVKCREGVEPSTPVSCTPSPPTATGTGNRSGSTSSRKRTAPPGSPSCARSSLAGSAAFGWSPRTRTLGSSTRSRPRCRERAGSGAGRTSCATS
jgi:Transposase, Mutator family